MKKRWPILFALAGLLVLSAHAAEAGKKEWKTFNGTWSCPICDAKHLLGIQTECEALGHIHALKLDNGKFVQFVKNERSEALIAGGGRHRTRIEICGFYDQAANTLDIECYKIDGKWTSWCSEHHRMDMCRWDGEPAPAEADEDLGK
jgi:hypothetical protein